MKAKIFGIGFHKTGTSSLARALTLLGFNTIHGDPRKKPPYGDEGRTLIEMIDKGNYELPTIEKYDAFTDNPYFSIWKQLDSNYPGSKFILTIRDPKKWIKSCLNFYAARRVRPMRVWMFGDHADPSVSEVAKTAWIEKYKEHNASIIKHFKDRSEDLLILDLENGDSWETLCSFLNVSVPTQPFPKKNVTNWKRKLGKNLLRLGKNHA